MSDGRDLDRLHDDLRALHARLREQTLERHGRMNPFTEDLFDWRERGQAWTRDDRGVTIYGSTTVAGEVEIGEHTWVGPYCSLDGTGGLTIGHHCSIALGAQLLTHDTARWALSGGTAEYEYAPTRIGDCCFVGTLAVVTKGVTVGPHSLVAAGAVVAADVDPYSIVAGVPARRIGSVELGDGGDVRLVYDG
jgi:acetyltransferase-like isoleucine patch superfamily enzyme